MNASFADLSQHCVDAVAAASHYTVRVRARRGYGASGIVLAPDLVVTAEHVIDPSQEGSISIGLPDGGETTASLVGRDPATDVAVLRVSAGGLTPAPAAAEARAGALALSVARPGREPQASLALVVGTAGPARTRRGGMLERFVMVDTVMYPGFSGGPLVDAAGGVLGMNTSGLNFGGPSIAIPWDLASSLARTIAEHGGVPRGYLGIGSQPVELTGAARDAAGAQERGLLVVNVADNGPSAQAGVLQGDILVQVNGEAVEDADDLQALLGPSSVGKAVTATLLRGGERRDLQITVGRRE